MQALGPQRRHRALHLRLSPGVDRPRNRLGRVHTTPRLSLLGPLELTGPDGESRPVSGELARTLLGELATARGHALSTETLIELLWGEEPPGHARGALQALVSRVRRLAPSGILLASDTGYRLGQIEVDLELAEAAATQAEAAAPASARMGTGTQVGPAASGIEELRAALALWRGTPGEGLAWPLIQEVQEAAAAVRERLLRALANALMGCDAASRPEAAEEALELWKAQAAASPFDETAVAGFMRALATAGRPAEAIEVFAAHRERLAETLGADPSVELARLNTELLQADTQRGGRARRIGLRSSPTALIGRDAEVDATEALTLENRLVSIVGPGGLGKTRLAQEVAARTPQDTSVLFLELAPIEAPDDVMPALAASLGIAELRAARALRGESPADLREKVIGALRERPTLLVLDNCEHLIAEAAGLADGLLRQIDSLRILTTSRAPLAIPDEVIAPLRPLPVGEDGAAVLLFTERARSARPGALLPVDTVRSICTRLDGSPLAIELAASRVRGMSVEEIDRRLVDRFSLLRGGNRSAPKRHHTLLAVIEWSWDLLSHGAQELLPRLALFPDGFTMSAAETMAPDGRADEVLDDLAELVEQSLVQLVERDGEGVRYRLLETVREFGRLRLESESALETVRGAMIAWGAAFGTEHQALREVGAAQMRLFNETRSEVDNLVVILRWALSAGDAGAVAGIFAALGTHWSMRGTHSEILAVAQDVFDVLDGVALPSDPLARDTLFTALVAAASWSAFGSQRLAARFRRTLRLLTEQGWPEDALIHAQTRLLLALPRMDVATGLLLGMREDKDPRVATLALSFSMPMLENEGEIDAALQLGERINEIVAEYGPLWPAGLAAGLTTQLYGQNGRPEDALVAAKKARSTLEMFGAEDDLHELGWTVGLASASLGRIEEARAVAREIAGLGHQGDAGWFDEDGNQLAALSNMIEAEVCRVQGDREGAIILYADTFRAVTAMAATQPRMRLWPLLIGSAYLSAVGELGSAGGLGGGSVIAPGGDVGGIPGGNPSGNPGDGYSATTTGTALAAESRQVARTVRTTALVSLRLQRHELDLPILGVGVLALAAWGAAADRLSPEQVAEGWGLALRLHSRQDFGPTRHQAVREQLLRRIARDSGTGAEAEAMLDAAATAHVGDTADAGVAAARAWLESLRP